MINIKDGALTVDGLKGAVILSDRQRDKPKTVRICDDGTGQLSVDPKHARWILADVEIPAIEYNEEGEGENVVSVRQPVSRTEIKQWRS